MLFFMLMYHKFSCLMLFFLLMDYKNLRLVFLRFYSESALEETKYLNKPFSAFDALTIADNKKYSVNSSGLVKDIFHSLNLKQLSS